MVRSLNHQIAEARADADPAPEFLDADGDLRDRGRDKTVAVTRTREEAEPRRAAHRAGGVASDKGGLGVSI